MTVKLVVSQNPHWDEVNAADPIDDLETFFREDMQPLGFAFQDAMTAHEEIVAGNMTGISTGFGVLDEYMRMYPQHYILLGGRPGVGKTAIGVQIAANVAAEYSEDGAVALFSAEMSPLDLAERMACASVEVTLNHYRTNRVDAETMQTIYENMQVFSEKYMNLWVDQSPAPSLNHMAGKLNILDGIYDIKLIVLDYLQLAGDMHDNETQRVRRTARQMKALARHFKCPVLVLAQLNRGADQRGERPSMSWFDYGGERPADCAAILQRPGLLLDDVPDTSMAFNFVKNRGAPTGKLTLAYNPALFTLYNRRVVLNGNS